MASDKQPTTAASAEKPEQPQPTAQKSAAALEEDDEFEDFPVEDWPASETEAAAQQQKQQETAVADAGEPGKEADSHLWEKSWDDDDTADDFSAQLREELRKVDAAKRR